MNIRRWHVVLALVASLGLFGTSVQSDESRRSIEPPPIDSPVVLDQVPDDSSIVVEPAKGTAQHFLRLACVNCQKGDERMAAARIREGVKVMRLQLRHATTSGKVVLQRSILELNEMANALERGMAASLKDVKAAFARSQHALAYHYQQRVEECRLRQNFKQAGQNLQAAADSVAYGMNWAGEAIETKSRDVIVATRDFGGSLLCGAQANARQLDAQSKALGQEIKRFGLQILQPIKR